ncbi:putative villin headpiece, villin/Gelsolin, ADF-H/Gelsolin-like domain superfamily [Plasmopara halstedii]
MVSDSAFAEAGKKAGLEAWRIENLKPVSVPSTSLHKLYSGDSYLFLKTSETTTGLTWNIHFWLGKDTSTDESGIAAYKTVELDDALGGVPVEHRECQGYESALFLSYFKATGLEYLDGGMASGFNEIKRDEYATCLYRIKGKRTVRVEQVPLKTSSLSVDDAYVLDAGLELYLYAGKEANRLEKAKALEFITKTREARGGRPTVTLMDEEPETPGFWKALGGFEPVTRSIETDEEHEIAVRKNTTIFRISGSIDDNLMVTDVTPPSEVLTKDILKSEDVFLIDVGIEIFVWVGKMASHSERTNALTIAVQYLKKEGRPPHTPITRVVEDGETPLFTALFKAWTEPKVLEFGYQSSQGVAKMQNDKSVDVNTLVKTTVKSEEDIGLDPYGDGKHDVTVWRIEKLEMVEVAKEQYGQFFDGDSYIILHEVTPSSGKPTQVIYIWQGRSSSTDEKAASALLTTFLDKSMHGSPIQVRVTQGKEPGHFRALFNGTMIVHAGGKASAFTNRDEEDSYDTDGVSLYQIKGTNEKNTAAVQVDEKTSSLTSGDCFILVTPKTVYGWHGCGSTSVEREIALKISSIFKKERDIEVFQEGDEFDEFWNFLGGKGEYAKIKSSFEAPHEPRLFQCSNTYGYFDAREILNFAQDDLNPDDVFLLDTYTTIYVWIGAGANEPERREAMSLAQKYLAVVKGDGRDAGTPIVAVHCNSEPLMFKSNFIAWDNGYFSKSEFLDPYKTRLQKLKEEKERNSTENSNAIVKQDIQEEEPQSVLNAPLSSSIPIAARAIPVLPTELPNPKVTTASPETVTTSLEDAGVSAEASVPVKNAPASVLKSATPAPSPAPTSAKATGMAGETFTYEQLKAGVEGIDITRKETYLSDAEFQSLMEMSKSDFEMLPKWKQQAKKKEYVRVRRRIFYRFTNSTNIKFDNFKFSLQKSYFSMSTTTQLGPKLAPFIPSGKEVLDHTLDLLALSSDDVLFDLGCGDARLLVYAANKTSATCIGVEYDGDLVKRAQTRVQEHGLEALVDIQYGNALNVDLTRATALFLYLMPQGIKMLMPKLEEARRLHVRIVTYVFSIPGWKIDDQRDYKGTKIYLYNSSAVATN